MGFWFLESFLKLHSDPEIQVYLEKRGRMGKGLVKQPFNLKKFKPSYAKLLAMYD